jgi:putative sigma-54 modulation protein
MQVAVSFRQLETSASLREYASEKLEHTVRKYIHGTVDGKVVLAVEKYWHIATFTLTVRGLVIKSREKSEDMYSSIDLALAKLDRQLRRYKDRIRDHKPAEGESMRFSLETIEATAIPTIAGYTEDELEEVAEEFEVDEALPDPEDYGYMDVAVEGHRAADGHGHVKVLRRAAMSAEAMTVADAIMRLDLSDQPFFAFTRTDTGSLNVVYRRDDGNYGLFETL